MICRIRINTLVHEPWKPEEIFLQWRCWHLFRFLVAIGAYWVKIDSLLNIVTRK